MPVYLENGTKVGLYENGILKKKAWKSKHLFKKMNAWGIDYGILHDRLKDDDFIQVYEQEEAVVYRTTVKNFKDNGTVLHFKEGTKDHYTQVFLPLPKWQRGTETHAEKVIS
jgi:hypothetical protein